MIKVAVVILNWNGRAMLERFLPSVLRHSLLDQGNEKGWQEPHETPLEMTSEVVVADNGSTDGSQQFMRENYPDVRLIPLDRNYGFTTGYNRALAQVEADYYVLLNSDVEPSPHWIQPVISMMEREENVAVAQPKMLMYDQRDTFEYAGAAGGYIDSYGYPFCRGRIFDTMERDHGQYDDECDIFWASGAALFVRSKVWKDLGGLDDDFFAHMEEIDFCWRVHNAGWRVRYCPRSVIYHVGGGTLPKSNPFKTELNFLNNLSMLYKNLPSARRNRVIALRMLLDAVAAIKFLCGGHADELRAVWRAHAEFRRRRTSLNEKRGNTVPPVEVPCVYRGKLLVEYYLLRRKTFLQLAHITSL